MNSERRKGQIQNDLIYVGIKLYSKGAMMTKINKTGELTYRNKFMVGQMGRKLVGLVGIEFHHIGLEKWAVLWCLISNTSIRLLLP